jgi:hypothetical protein
VGTLTIDGGELLLAAEDERLITARLVPFHEECQSNLGRFTVAPGTLELPADATVAIMNDGHRRELPLASGVVYAERADGVYGSWRLAKSPEADAALADIKAGRRGAVSVEAEVVVEGGRATAGRIFGAALVSAGKRGAFPSAVLLATAATPPSSTRPTRPRRTTRPSWSIPTRRPVRNRDHGRGDRGDRPRHRGHRSSRPRPPSQPITPGANARQKGARPWPLSNPSPPPTRSWPSGPRAACRPRCSAAARGPQARAGEPVNRRQLSLLLAKAAPVAPRRGVGRQAARAAPLRARRRHALRRARRHHLRRRRLPNDMIVPQWIGELWSGRSYQRRWIPLFNSATLTSRP